MKIELASEGKKQRKVGETMREKNYMETKLQTDSERGKRVKQEIVHPKVKHCDVSRRYKSNCILNQFIASIKGTACTVIGP